ncbi:MAG: hypothetical protein WAX66_00400 [Patescibacteria group bacterium]
MNKVFEYIKRKVSIVELSTLLLFVIFIPLISKVTFMQNDDWNRTTSIIRFLKGDFSLIQKTATTFYTQGILGYLFSLVFGWEKLPFLTLVFSVFNFYLLAKILLDYFNLSKVKSCILSLLLFFTPLHMYSVIGFMTENYTLFFILLSIYFFLSYEKNLKLKNLILFNVGGIFAFFSKQNGIIIQVASIPYFIFKKRYKEALIQTLFILSTFSYYYFLFPRTNEMRDKDFLFTNILNTQYSYSLVYGIMLVVSSFILPILINFVLSSYLEIKKNIKLIAVLLISSALCFIFLNKWFTPGKISWEEYPYFENTFERTGFFPRSISGTKYQFKYNYDLYRYWDLASKILLSLTIPCLFLYKKRLVNVYSISILGYIVLMIFVKTFFDRYLLPLIPLFILFFFYIRPPDLNVSRKLSRMFSLTTFLFVAFTAFLSIQMSIDFVLTNNYVWEKSESLVNNGISPEHIKATMAWEKVYGVSSKPEYLFSFDDFNKNPELYSTHTLVEDKIFTYPGNIFIDSVVYLYKAK